MPLTLQGVAKLAGLSAATVSRCLHSPHLVRPDTRQRVLRLMDEHKYVHNIMAADFSRRRSSVVAVIMPTPAVVAFAQTLIGIQEVAFTHNTPLFVASTHYKPNKERAILQQCLEHRFSGVIMAGFDPSNADLIEVLQSKGISHILLWEKSDNPNICYVGIDNYQSARTAMDYLFSIGHRRVAAVMGPLETSNRTRHRLLAYRDTLESWGVPYDPDLVLIKEPVLSSGKEVVTYFLSTGRLPTAIFAGSDFISLAIMSELREHGVRVPEDVSVCGFDGNEISVHIVPQLTSVRVPTTEMGRQAMTFLTEMLKGEKRDQLRQCLLPTELVVRRSCAPVRTPDTVF